MDTQVEWLPNEVASPLGNLWIRVEEVSSLLLNRKFLSERQPMFREYTDTGGERNRRRNFEYLITDDDFTATGIINRGMIHMSLDVAEAVIQTYLSRNLSVAPNLFRAMLWLRDTHHYSLDDQVRWNNDLSIVKDDPDHPWNIYFPEIKMYLLFS